MNKNIVTVAVQSYQLYKITFTRGLSLPIHRHDGGLRILLEGMVIIVFSSNMTCNVSSIFLKYLKYTFFIKLRKKFRTGPLCIVRRGGMRVNNCYGREGIKSEEHCWEGINLGFFKT